MKRIRHADHPLDKGGSRQPSWQLIQLLIITHVQNVIKQKYVQKSLIQIYIFIYKY